MTTQDNLPGIPAPVTDQVMWRVNYQFAGSDYGLRNGVLIIPATTITEAKALAASTIFDKTGGRWSNITKIVNITEVPF